MTISQAISDIELRLYAGKPSDDADIPRSQIKYWLNGVNSSSVANWIVSENGGEIPSFATHKIDCIGVKSEKPVCLNDCNSYVYIELPDAKLLDLIDEKSIVSLYRGTQEILNYGTSGRAKINSNLRFSDKSPFFNRMGNRLYLFNGVYPPFSQFDLVYGSVDLGLYNETQAMPTPNKLLPLIFEEVEKIGLRELGSKKDLISDGIDG